MSSAVQVEVESLRDELLHVALEKESLVAQLDFQARLNKERSLNMAWCVWVCASVMLSLGNMNTKDEHDFRDNEASALKENWAEERRVLQVQLAEAMDRHCVSLD